jgi:hypothetical protein
VLTDWEMLGLAGVDTTRAPPEKQLLVDKHA